MTEDAGRDRIGYAGVVAGEPETDTNTNTNTDTDTDTDTDT